jgi:uncharacterized protein with NAD-binding domain and iron-sulfur cluster
MLQRSNLASAGKRVAVVGGGWAGCAAAVELAAAGRQVTLYEAARSLGGRANTLVSGLTFGHFAGVRSDNRTFRWCQV